MKQILQSARSGDLELVEVPAPAPQAGQVLVRNAFSVVSPGTERLMMDFARKSLLAKARSRPDLVRQVTRKIRHDGPLTTYRAVMTRLESPQPLGYSCAGVVEAVGAGVTGFRTGDRVACAGAGYANHAEWIVVPENLVAPVPDEVPLEKAAFATLGSIAMQGLRVADPSLGEVAAVIGLGLIGQLAVQLLRANGCRVLALDLDDKRVEQGRQQGADWAYPVPALPDGWGDAATQGHGADLALVTAASNSSAPIQLGAELCRHKGRVVLVGMMPMDLDRRTFYEKELELRMSMSYGPGRYDRRFEEVGLDYPLPYVRWTENRNLRSFLELAAQNAIDPARLDCTEVPFETAEDSYRELAEGSNASLGIIFRYSEAPSPKRALRVAKGKAAPLAKGELGISLIGAGNYAKGMLLPTLDGAKHVHRASVVATTGPSALRTAEKHGFAACTTDPEDVFRDENTHLVIIATRHDSHADLATRALRAGKAVWLEKPAGLHPEEVEALACAARETGGFLTLGYNRRFSQHARTIRQTFASRTGPLAIHYRIAAGPTPVGTWITDPAVGGGRIVGEVCHFVDLCLFLVGSAPQRVYAHRLGADSERDDSTVAVLSFPDGSSAVIEYLANTGEAVPKERFEVSADGRTGRCENFRSTRIAGAKAQKTLNQDKGQATAMKEVLAAIRNGDPSPFSIDDVVAVSAATFAIEASIQRGAPVDL